MSSTDLYALVQQLQARVAALEQRPTTSEELSPNYLTVTPSGVGANFTGHVAATGVDLTEAGGAPGPVNFVDWLDSSGVIQEAVYGQLVAGRHLLRLRVPGPGAISPSVGAFTLTLLDDQQHSDFIQGPPGGPFNLQFNQGLVTFTWTAAGLASAQLAIPYGLPQFVLSWMAMAAPDVAGTTSFTVQESAGPDATNLHAQMIASVAQPINTLVSAYWWAISLGP